MTIARAALVQDELESGLQAKVMIDKHGGEDWWLKAISLVILTGQSAAAALLMRQSRAGSVQWISQTAVILQEIMKGLLSLGIVLGMGEKLSSVTASRREILRSGVPAFLYLLQNNLQYVALTYLDAATYAATYQLKILSTAVLSVWILRRHLNVQKWLALIVLVIGVVAVQAASLDQKRITFISGIGKAASDRFIGLAAVMLATLCSGLAGVYFEKILKESSVSLWVRNVHLAVYSIILGLIGLAATDDLERIRTDGFFVGYNFWTIVAVANNSFGGLLIAVVIKYADNILKNFSCSLAIVLTTVISQQFLGLRPSLLFHAGVFTVCYSVFLYGGILSWQLYIPGFLQVCRVFRRGCRFSPGCLFWPRKGAGLKDQLEL